MGQRKWTNPHMGVVEYGLDRLKMDGNQTVFILSRERGYCFSTPERKTIKTKEERSKEERPREGQVNGAERRRARGGG